MTDADVATMLERTLVGQICLFMLFWYEELEQKDKLVLAYFLEKYLAYREFYQALRNVPDNTQL